MSAHARGRNSKQQRDDDDNVICPLDQLRVRDHPRCQQCHILIGPLHYEKIAYEQNGRTICGNCVRWLAKRRKR